MVKSPSFFSWVGGVWAGLSKKETYEYNKVQDEESEIFVGQPRPYTDDEENVGLLAESPQDLITEKPKRRSRCCASNCSLLWKALAVVLTVAGAWYAVKLIIWAVRPAPSGLDRMPVYKTSLGCLSAPFTSKMSLSVPAGPRSDHAVDVHGGSPGTIFITEGAADSVEVQYELLFATNDEGLLSQVAMIYPTEEKVENSRVLISTPYTGETDACMRFDIVVRVPPTLKKLHVASHAVAQVQFDPEANIKLDTFFVTLYAMKENNMILPHENLHADHLMLEVYKGWIVGDVSIVNSTSIATQRGNGITNVRMHPLHQQRVEPAVLQTTTGAGRTDIFYIADHSVPHRPIRSSHVSAMNANVYLTYKHADFNGLLSVGSRSYTETGLQEINGTTTDLSEFGEEWTHWAGDKKGGDRISVKSRGWTGLYFE